jgi:hypothetical protein
VAKSFACWLMPVSMVDMTENETAKLHVRYMIGGQAHGGGRVRVPPSFRATGRAAALESIGTRCISMFHYRNHSSDYGACCGRHRYRLPSGRAAPALVSCATPVDETSHQGFSATGTEDRPDSGGASALRSPARWCCHRRRNDCPAGPAIVVIAGAGVLSLEFERPAVAGWLRPGRTVVRTAALRRDAKLARRLHAPISDCRDSNAHPTVAYSGTRQP